MSDDMDNDDEAAAAVLAIAMRAKKMAGRAITRFVMSEAKAKPDGRGAILVAGMQAGFLLSLIEAWTAFRGHDKHIFLELAGAVYDDVLDRESQDEVSE